jgi:hypothetical protein
VVILDWRRLALEADEHLDRRDLGLMNLGCAAGLPVSERINHRFCVRWLERVTEYVRQFTAAALPGLRKNPLEYQSEAQARVLCLVTALQRNVGVSYNPDKMAEGAPFGAEDIFLHGLIQGPGGTCSTMPVLYVTVGQRLGYPLRLVEARRHRFCRWDEPGGERLNVEATNKGLTVFPDDYYRVGRYQVSPAEESHGGLLRSMTARQALASFIADRGLVWAGHGKWRQCVDCFLWAIIADSGRNSLKTSHIHWMERWQQELIRRAPPGFPALDLQPFPRRYPPVIPVEVEAHVRRFEVWENLLNDAEHEARWWHRLRRGECGVAPLGAVARARADGGYEVGFHLQA